MLRSKGKWICLSANVHYLFHSWESNQQVMCLNILILVMNLLQKLNFYSFFSDGPNVDLAFVKKKICGLHIVHNSFQYGETASHSSIRKLINAIFKIFDVHIRSPTRCTD